MKYCLQCFNKFEPKTYHQVYCSNKCNRRHWHIRYEKLKLDKPKYLMKKCPNCEKIFMPMRSWHRFCSKKCQHNNWNKNVQYSPKNYEESFNNELVLINTFLELKKVGR